MNRPVFSKFTLMNGSTCELLMINGGDISRANRAFDDDDKNPEINPELKGLDRTPYILQQVCLIDGEQKDVLYFINLSTDDYIKINEEITPLITPINTRF